MADITHILTSGQTVKRFILCVAVVVATSLHNTSECRDDSLSDEAFMELAGVENILDKVFVDDTELVLLESAQRELKALNVIDFADSFVGRPYRRGGKTPKGFDCSGFTSYVFGHFDRQLGASSRSQYTQGEPVSRDRIQPGDLLFFSGRRGGKTVGHVGIAVEVEQNGAVKFIHSATSGGIRYDRYPDGGYYSSRYIGARRIL